MELNNWLSMPINILDKVFPYFLTGIMEQLSTWNLGYEHKRSDFNKIFFEGPVSGFVGSVLLQMLESRI